MVANQSLMSITARPAPIMVRGSGSYLWDDNGKRYLDFIQGWAVNALGHCPQQIVDALIEQGTSLITPSPALHNAPQLQLADKLVQLSGLSQVHFSNSGSEANEVAIKLARKWGQIERPGASDIITTHNSFHGRTLATMAAGGKPGWDKLFPPQVPGFKKVDFGDIAAMADAIDEKTLAIMVEPIQGEAGVIVPPPDYLTQLRQLADAHGVLLILDEIQTGVGRTGSFFAFEQHQIKPDIVTLGKGLGGGVPVSATIAAEHVCCFEHGDQGGTYNGNPLMTAVALAVVETVCETSFLQSVHASGVQLNARLLELSADIDLAQVRGAGLLQAIELGKPVAAAVQQLAMDAGLLINAPRPATIRLMPALNVTQGQIDEAVRLIVEAIRQV
jgi:acetylornithine/N-succinyldiaminopimelate aminotransferase